MKTTSLKLSALAAGFILAGCDGSSTTDTAVTSTNNISKTNGTVHGNVDMTLPTTYTANAGRLLGSQCAQCHGTNGVSSTEWDSIAGEDELESEMFEDDEPIMSAQAHGYTSEEIILIENWLITLNTKDLKKDR